MPVGGERIHAHSMRSTYATNLYRNTQDINLVADALGHNDLETVKKYTKSGEENREREANFCYGKF
ncbi:MULTISPECIES: site-specific integrase [unclassified Bilifractor]|uniref:site-specific integrase n=1 Tax=unclassified Bilifractor TaxID=2815795 RepID=UPI003F9007B3